VRRIKWAVLLTAVLLLAAACGEDDGGTDAGAEGGDGGQAASTEGLRVAYASDLDPNDMADQMGIESAGAEVITLNEDSQVVAGLTRGDVDVGNIGFTEAIKASQSGVPLKIFYVSQRTFEFVMVSQPEITSFDQLAGEKVAFHEPGSGTEIEQRQLVRQHDPALEDEIDWVVLPESPNRAAALAAGEIAASSIEYADLLAIQKQGDFNVLGTWTDIEGSSADAVSTVWVTSEDYYNENKATLEAFAEELQKGYDKFYDDKEGWLDFASEKLPDVDRETLSETYDFYKEQGMYPQSGEPPITPELWASWNEFFTQIGEYEQPASEEIVDYDIVKSVAGG
jgi:ABC-type nitrate/sulfonate/bicarbonate transport system substrate-binding protein